MCACRKAELLIRLLLRHFTPITVGVDLVWCTLVSISGVLCMHVLSAGCLMVAIGSDFLSYMALVLFERWHFLLLSICSVKGNN